MSKIDLKNAMESLQVNKPLRLKTPAFKAPESPKVSEVQNTTQDEISSQDPFSTEDEKLTEDRNRTQAYESSVDRDRSQDEFQTQDETNEQMVPRKSQPRKATTQDQSLMHLLEFKDKLRSGYTRIPNSILMDLLSGEYSPVEMKIILLVARMTIGFKNRPYAPLSKRVIETLIGSQGGSILQALQKLEKAGVLKKIAGDQMNPNQFGLNFDDKVFDSDPNRRTWGEKTTRDENITQVKKESQGVKTPNNKDNYINNNKNIISLSNISIHLKEYFSNLKPQSKRESEYRQYQILREDFTDEQIIQSLSFLQENGLLHSGQHCHSPMAYLSQAIVQVLKAAQQKYEKHEKVAESQRIQNMREVEMRENQRREDAEIEIREKAFNEAFPTPVKQQEAISHFSKQYGGFFKSKEMTRSLAIVAWWNSNQKTVVAF